MIEPLEGHSKVNGISIRYRIDGKAAGRPWLVFSNSLMTDLSLWDDQVAALGGKYQILRYDQRGHGKSSVNDTPCTLDVLTDDVMGLLDAVGVDRFTFIGISMGAATGLRVAQRFPNRVERLILSAGRPMTPPGGAQAWEDRINIAQKGGMEALVEITVKRWFHAKSFDGNPAAIQRVREMIRATPLNGFIACVRMLQNYDVQAQLGAIRMPTLMIAGAVDADAPQVARDMQGKLGNGAVVVVPDAGHLTNIEAPAAFNTALSGFLSAAS